MRPQLSDYRHLGGGKVRELYEIDGETMLLVASDRISAYDHVLETPIPDKGRVLTAMSFSFFDALGVENHLAGPADDPRIPEDVLGRAMVVRRLDMAQAECVARGYLTGSGLAEYETSGTVCGIALPDGLTEASRLPEPIFTPATKAAQGDHDENISFERLVEIVGADLAERLRTATLDIYSRAAAIAREKGIILADTKFEFGLGADGELVLADEVLTPDSSRYWPADTWAEGAVQPSFDKQIVRNWLTGPESGWDRSSESAPPPLPAEIVERTRARYIEAYERISGRSFAEWPGGGDATTSPSAPTPSTPSASTSTASPSARLEPPVAAKVPVVRGPHHGREFVDDYEWMRDPDSPDTRAHLEAENAYTDQELAPIESLRERVYDEIRSRIKQTDMSVPTRSGSWWYFSRTEEGKSYGRYCRVPVDRRFVDAPLDVAGWVPPEIEAAGALEGEQLLLDGNVEAEGHDFFSLGAFATNFAEDLVAYSTDVVGDERYTLRFRALAESTVAPDEVIRDIAPGVTFSRDDRFVFYVTVDEAWRPDTVWRHELGTDPASDVRIFHEPDEAYWVGVGMTRSERFLEIVLGSKVTSEAWLLDSSDPTGEFWCVRPREEGVEYDVEHAAWGGEDRLVLTHNAGAPNFVVGHGPVAPVAEWSSLVELVPHRDDVRVEGVDSFLTALVLSYRENALPRVAVARLRGAEAPLDGAAPATSSGELGEFEPVDFDEELYTSGLGANGEWITPVLRMGYGSYVTPGRVYDVTIDSGARTLLREQEVLGDFDPSAYVQRREWATAPDGTRVPVSLVMSVGTAARIESGSPAPTLLYGYGSYESSMDPYFSVGRLSLMERGMVYAVAHVRGGGEMGRTWYEDGKVLHKKNTFTDFIACADRLVEAGVSETATLIAEGGSAGGLLMGAVANMAPERFRGILASVPFVDPLTSILMPELPLTVIEWDEWGNPLADPEVYDYMASYAPYDNVEAKDYPAMLVVTSLNDTRVLYVEPAKWVAKLRELSTSANEPGCGVLLQCEMDAGHGGVSGRYEAWRQSALELSWVLATAGIVE